MSAIDWQVLNAAATLAYGEYRETQRMIAGLGTFGAAFAVASSARMELAEWHTAELDRVTLEALAAQR